MKIQYMTGGRSLGQFGAVAEAQGLPRDEQTAVVVLAALKARNIAPDMGAYTAIIDNEDGSEPQVIDEADGRVRLAAEAFRGMGRNRPYSSSEMNLIRKALTEGILTSPRDATD